MRGAVRNVAILALVALVVWACTFTVAEGETGIVLRFGSPVADRGPGLHFKLPLPIESVIRVDRRTHVLDPSAAEYLTVDKKNIVVDAFLAWRVVEPRKFVVTLGTTARAETQLTDVLRSILLDVLSSQDFASLVSAKPGAVTIKEIGDDITARIRERTLERFGVDVKRARIKRVNYPGQNKEAVYRRMEADRKALARGYRAEGEEEYQKIQARTDRQATELEAEAARTAKEIRNGADADVQRIKAEASEKDPELWRFLQRLELFEATFNERATIILPVDDPLLDAFRRPPLEEPVAPQKPGKAGN